MTKPLFAIQSGQSNHHKPAAFAVHGEPRTTFGVTTKSLAAHLNMPPEAAAALFRPVLEKLGESPLSLSHHDIASALPEFELRVVEVLPSGLANLVIAGLHAYVRSVC